MTTEALLSRLPGVRRTPRGWVARCPAHPDNNPSLSIKEGERGVLLKCWAGCQINAICSSLTIQKRDLFFDTTAHRSFLPISRPARLDRRRIALDFELHAISLQERAEKTFQAASGLDCTSWSGDDFDKAMAAVGRAFDDMQHAEILFAVADSQREKAFQEGR